MAVSEDLTSEELLAWDRQHLWHPYSSMLDPAPVYPVVSASGVRIKLADGRELIDGMSSWWSAIHGYNHPVLNEAAEKQLAEMSHVMFGGLTHPAAVRLARQLVDITPPSLSKVFLADSGSVSVEVAIKMALQYWYSTGHKGKQRLLALRSGYHGDTFGAMAACDPVTGMHHLFRDALPQHVFVDSPGCRFGEPADPGELQGITETFERHHRELAAVILEPIVQGAGGMHFYSADYLRHIRRLCDEYDVLLIHDEIATGFGRSGRLFACEHADIEPDIMAVGKALTGGYLTLAATLCTDKVARGICEGEAGSFMHGPTFMGNPLACAVASASIELLLSQPWQATVQRLEEKLREGLAPAAMLDNVADVRAMGAIGVIEMKEPVDMATMQPQFVERGVWVRPFGRLVYIMPPYIISDKDLESLMQAMVETVSSQ